MTRTTIPDPLRETLGGILAGFALGMLAVGFALGAVVLFSGLGMGVFGQLEGLESDAFHWGAIAAVALALVVGWLAGFTATRVGGYRSGIGAAVLLVVTAGLVLAVLRGAGAAAGVLMYTSPLPLVMLAGALMGRKRRPKADAPGDAPGDAPDGGGLPQ